jgi:sorting nexin-9/18/33
LRLLKIDIFNTVQEVGEGRYNWLATKGPYSCVIASPKKEAKFKGLKSFIAYQLTPSVSFFLVS